MEFDGKIKDIAKNWQGKTSITFEVSGQFSLDDSLLEKDLSISVKPYRKRRSRDANALLWSCIGDISAKLGADKWEIYLMLLKKYGKFTYICVKPNVVDAVRSQWRECEVIGNVNINGAEAVQMLCYFGSSTYDSKEFTRLLEGTIEDMKELGLSLPPSREMKEALLRWDMKK